MKRLLSRKTLRTRLLVVADIHRTRGQIQIRDRSPILMSQHRISKLIASLGRSSDFVVPDFMSDSQTRSFVLPLRFEKVEDLLPDQICYQFPELERFLHNRHCIERARVKVGRDHRALKEVNNTLTSMVDSGRLKDLIDEQHELHCVDEQDCGISFFERMHWGFEDVLVGSLSQPGLDGWTRKGLWITILAKWEVQGHFCRIEPRDFAWLLEIFQARSDRQLNSILDHVKVKYMKKMWYGLSGIQTLIACNPGLEMHVIDMNREEFVSELTVSDPRKSGLYELISGRGDAFGFQVVCPVFPSSLVEFEDTLDGAFHEMSVRSNALFVVNRYPSEESGDEPWGHRVKYHPPQGSLVESDMNVIELGGIVGPSSRQGPKTGSTSEQVAVECLQRDALQVAGLVAEKIHCLVGSRDAFEEHLVERKVEHQVAIQSECNGISTPIPDRTSALQDLAFEFRVATHEQASSDLVHRRLITTALVNCVSTSWKENLRDGDCLSLQSGDVLLRRLVKKAVARLQGTFLHFTVNAAAEQSDAIDCHFSYRPLTPDSHGAHATSVRFWLPLGRVEVEGN